MQLLQPCSRPAWRTSTASVRPGPKQPPQPRPHDEQKVLIGNALARFSASVFGLCERLRISAVIENAHTRCRFGGAQFRTWLKGGYADCEERPQWNTTDFCRDGTPWQKRTSFVSTVIELHAAMAPLCERRGRSTRTRLPHQRLRGIQPSAGRYLTIIAEPHPCKLWRHIAAVLARAMQVRRAREINACTDRAFGVSW